MTERVDALNVARGMLGDAVERASSPLHNDIAMADRLVSQASQWALCSIAESLAQIAAHQNHDFGWSGEGEFGHVQCPTCGKVQP